MVSNKLIDVYLEASKIATQITPDIPGRLFRLDDRQVVAGGLQAVLDHITNEYDTAEPVLETRTDTRATALHEAVATIAAILPTVGEQLPTSEVSGQTLAIAERYREWLQA